MSCIGLIIYIMNVISNIFFNFKYFKFFNYNIEIKMETIKSLTKYY